MEAKPPLKSRFAQPYPYSPAQPSREVNNRQRSALRLDQKSRKKGESSAIRLEERYLMFEHTQHKDRK